MRKAPSARLAVIGLGPRGLGALEALAFRWPATAAPLVVDIFEPFESPGAGPNFAPAESEICQLNIPFRDIDIRRPEPGPCGAFDAWLTGPTDPDAFPPRALLGAYLEARLSDLRQDRALDITLHATQVTGSRRDAEGWHIACGSQEHGPYDEVLLTPGQPSVRPDDQLAEWQAHAKGRSATLMQAYPARALQDRAAGWSGARVAVRGLALSAFDVVRVLTVAQGGQFEAGRYIASGREPERIVPFSLDGLPPFPKPETEALDARFAPTQAETTHFTDQMMRAAAASPDAARRLINAALLPPVQRIQQALGADTTPEDIASWLDTEWRDPGTQEATGPEETLHLGIEMAAGTRRPSIGYTVGQVWRKWQDQVRHGYNPATTPSDTAEALIGFDEGLKRYSYGPPVSSSREMAMLIEAGIVDLSFATDPDISLVAEGWQLDAGGQTQTAEVMIDAVLPSPDLSIVTASLLSNLVEDGTLRPVSNGLGAETRADGTPVGRDGRVTDGLAFLGRMALGSVIAVDSLHDCFGEASHRWAEGALARLAPTARDTVRDTVGHGPPHAAE